MFVHFPFCWALFHIYLFLHVCRSFSVFPFLVLFSCLETFFKFVLVLECCSLLVSFSVSLFLKTLFGLNIVFLYLRNNSPFTCSLSSSQKKQSFFFFEWFLLYCPFFFFKKKCFLLVGPPKRVMFLLCFSLVLLFSKKKTCKISCCYQFLNLLFLNHVVFCFMFLDRFRNMFPLQCVLYLFISSFRSSSFHLFSLFCLLLFSRFFHLFLPIILNFLFFGLSIIFMFLCVKHCAKKMYLFRLQQHSLFLSSHFRKKKKLRFLCFLFCRAFFLH